MTTLAQGRNRGAQVGLGAWQKESGEDRLRLRFLISPRPQVMVPQSRDGEAQVQRRSLDVGVGDRVEEVRAWSRDGTVRRRPRALTMDSNDANYDPSQWKSHKQVSQKQEQGNGKQLSTAVQVHAIEFDQSPPLATTPCTPRPNRNTNFSRPLSVISPKASSLNQFQNSHPLTPKEPQSQKATLPQTPPRNLEIPTRGSSRQIPQTPPPETPTSFQQTFPTGATDNTSAHPPPRSSRWTSALTSIRRRGFSISSGPLSPQRKGKAKPSPLTQGNLKRLESQTVTEGGDATAGLVHLGMVRPNPMQKRESMPLPPSPFFSPDLAKEHFGTQSPSPTPGARKGHQRAQSHSQFLSRGQAQRLQNQNQLQRQNPYLQQSLHSRPLASRPAPAPPTTLSPPHLPPIKRKPTPLTLPSLEKHLPPYPSPLKDDAFHTAHSITLLSPKSLRLTCSVCKDMKELSAFPTKRFTERCTHNPHTCKDCTGRWVGECVEGRGWRGVVCPECGEGMEWADVRAVVGEGEYGGVLERYENFALREMLNSLPGFSWCTNPTCSSGQIQVLSPSPAPTSTTTKFTCLSCGHVHCINHPTTPYHSGESCAEFDARLAEGGASGLRELERAGEKLVREIGKRCPNALCGYWIEKVDGCDVVTCWKCGWKFCWECGARIGRRGGRFHRQGCKWY